MKPFSIDTNYFLPPILAPSRLSSDRRLAVDKPRRSPDQPQPVRKIVAGRFSSGDDHVSNGLSLGLIALTLPTVGYAFYQLWHLVGGETLNQAVRAFAP